MSTLLLLHGFLGAPSSWAGVLAPLRERGALSNVEVLRPVLPGHGRPAEHLDVFGEATLDGESTSLEATVDMLGDLIPEEGRAIIAGYSMGARLALAIASRHPARVAGLVLVGVHPGLPGGAARDERRQWDDEQARRLRDDGLARFVDAWERMPLFESQRALPHAALAAQRATRLGHDADSLALAVSALGLGRQPDLSGGLARPATLLAGALDRKFTAVHAELAARSPGTTARTVDGAGHNLTLEAPLAVADAIEQLLRETGTRRRSARHDPS